MRALWKLIVVGWDFGGCRHKRVQQWLMTSKQKAHMSRDGTLRKHLLLFWVLLYVLYSSHWLSSKDSYLSSSWLNCVGSSGTSYTGIHLLCSSFFRSYHQSYLLGGFGSSASGHIDIGFLSFNVRNSSQFWIIIFFILQWSSTFDHPKLYRCLENSVFIFWSALNKAWL